MDRREFLIMSGKVGLVAGIGPPPPVASEPPSVDPHSPPSPVPTAAVASSAAHDNAIGRENALVGTDAWSIGDLPATIQGYLNPASVRPGDRLSVHVDSAAAFDIEWYRLGWYGAAVGGSFGSTGGCPPGRAAVRSEI